MIRRLLVALALLVAVPAFAQQTISTLPQVATPRDADLLPLDVQSYPVGQRTHAVSALGLSQYILGKIPLGPQGIAGPAGATGAANTLSIGTVSGSAPGSNPLVAITGTAPAQVLNFTLPTGASGPTGAAGPTGPAGPAGPQGTVGATGQTGPPNVLSIGAVTNAAPGNPAQASVSGAAPNQALNLTLPQGIQGPVGPVGPTGSGTGNVLGPSGTITAGDLATFSDTTGTRLADGGTLGPAATKPLAFFLQSANNLGDLGSVSTARTNLGLGGAALLNVGTASGTVASGNDSRITGALQSLNNLSDLASTSTARNNLGLGTAATQANAFFLQSASNLGDVANVGTARSNLGLGTIATQGAGSVAITGGTINGISIGGTTPAAGAFTTISATTPVPVTSGGTGGSTATTARSGISAAASGSNSDITSLSGLTTPLSVSQGGTGATTTTGSGANVLAASPALTGTPTVPTATAGTSTTQAASTAFVASSFLATANAASTYAPLASPALTGIPTAPTATAGTNTTQVATTAFVLANGGGSGAPSAVNGQSAAYTAAAADKGKVLNLTGSSTLTLGSGTATAGWYVFVKKVDGNGVWAITPSSGTIDGLASINCYQESYLIWYDATNSVYRTQGRPKGWISVSTTVTAALVSSVSFTTGFTDPELRDAQVAFDNMITTSNDYPAVRVAKGGAFLTSGYNSFTIYSGGGAPSGASSTAFIYLGVNTNATTYAGEITIYNIGLSTPQRASAQCFGNGNYFTLSNGFQTTSGAVTGLQIYLQSGTNMSIGATFVQRMYRP